MAYTAYRRPRATDIATRAAGDCVHFRCDTEADRPSTNVQDGDSAYTLDTKKFWDRDGGAWVECGDASNTGGGGGPHTHPISDVTNLQASLDAKSDVGHTHAGGSGAPAVYINLINHFTTLENTTSANATWKIPAATTYGQVSALLDMTKLGSPTSATFFVVYTNTATSGTNQIGFTLGSTPRAAGTTVTQVASSAVTMANSSTYPQTVEKAVTISELGSTKQWLQVCLNIATSTVGPNIFSAGLILYY